MNLLNSWSKCSKFQPKMECFLCNVQQVCVKNSVCVVFLFIKTDKILHKQRKMLTP